MISKFVLKHIAAVIFTGLLIQNSAFANERICGAVFNVNGVQIEIKFGPVEIHTPDGRTFVINAAPNRPLVTPAPSSTATLGRRAFRDHFRTLAAQGALISQGDRRLGDRGLLRTDGGLCATTCGVNVLHAAFRHSEYDTSQFVRNSDGMIQQMVDYVWTQHHWNARLGLSLERLGEAMIHVATDMNFNLKANVIRDRVSNIASTIENLPEDTLAILAVDTGYSRIHPDERTSHAVVMVDVDPHAQKIWYVDPNYPNEVRVAGYSRSRGGERARAGIGYSNVQDDDSNIILGVLLVQNTQGNAHQVRQQNASNEAMGRRYQRFVGKAVRIYYKENPDRPRETVVSEVINREKYRGGPVGVVSYTYLFGSGGGGTSTFDSIDRIEEIEIPQAYLARLQDLRGKTITITFPDAYSNERYGHFEYDVESVETPSADYPLGSLRLKAKEQAGEGYHPAGLVGFEMIRDFQVIHERPQLTRRPRRAS